MSRSFVLINANIVRPPVSPVGLEYAGHSLVEGRVPVQVIDLAFEPDWRTALQAALKHDEPLAAGVSVRNTDDCCFVSRKSFLPWISEVVGELRKLTPAPVFLGGVGFSTMPELVLEATRADGGIRGDGEEALLILARTLEKKDELSGVPNLLYRRDGLIVRNDGAFADLRHRPLPQRRLFDNRRYERQGAMVGLETKRGCSQGCIFCADPVAKGRTVRLRPPDIVVREIQDLVDQGISWLHLCDSEFNLPVEHAKEVCRAIIENGLGDRIRWYTYCSPVPFDDELAGLMRRAGCAGINFGIDSFSDEQLSRLGRVHTAKDVYRLINLLTREGLNYILDLLLGGPGETFKTVKDTIETAKRYDARLVGVAFGVRVYPGTRLHKDIANGPLGKSVCQGMPCAAEEPAFFISPFLGDDPAAMISRLVASDRRFLLLSTPSETGSYNYAGDEMLARAIEKGARGAYWDIIGKNLRT